MPGIYGEGNDPVEALHNLTEKVHAVLQTTLALLNCNELDETLFINRRDDNGSLAESG